jgi:hypothetical protein
MLPKIDPCVGRLSRTSRSAVSFTVSALLSMGSYPSAPEIPLRDSDLQSIFQSINEHYFGSRLRDVEVSWADLTNVSAQGLTLAYDDGSFRIELDRAKNTNVGHARSVLKHEACHVETMKLISADLHGPLFRACMLRFR